MQPHCELVMVRVGQVNKLVSRFIRQAAKIWRQLLPLGTYFAHFWCLKFATPLPEITTVGSSFPHHSSQKKYCATFLYPHDMQTLASPSYITNLYLSNLERPNVIRAIRFHTHTHKLHKYKDTFKLEYNSTSTVHALCVQWHLVARLTHTQIHM